jgi:hypothetical protein
VHQKNLKVKQKSMCSNVLVSAFENPCFVIDTELPIESLQELGTQQRVDSSADAPTEHHERASLSNSIGKCSSENALPVISRTSISGTSEHSAPLEHLENFLSDARSSLDDSPVAALRRLSVVKFDTPEEDDTRFFKFPICFFSVVTIIT